MPRLTFVEADGSRREIEAASGRSVLEIARHHEIDIEGACDGSCACATCHVIVDPGDSPRLPAPGDEERDMLDLAFGVTATSRLGCRVVVTDDLDGLTLIVPAGF